MSECIPLPDHVVLLRSIVQTIAPDVGIFAGDRAFLFVSTASVNADKTLSPRTSRFSSSGRVLLRFEWLVNKERDLIVTMLMRPSNTEKIWEEGVMFSLGDEMSDQFPKAVENMKQEILNCVNKITGAFF